MTTPNLPTPVGPIMGECFETPVPGSGTWNARVGGKPKSDWSGLDTSVRGATGTVGKRSALCYRPLILTNDQKGQISRSKGLSAIFKQGDSIRDFQNNVWDHLKKHGMDTIAYLQDPQDPTQVLSVVVDHAKFRADATKFQQLANLFRDKFDEFDAANDAAACDFILDSIDQELKKTMRFKSNEDDSFAAYWLKLMKQIISSSTDRYDAIKDRIKERTPHSYAGQNIEAMSIDNQTDAEELISGGYYEHSLTKAMVAGYQKSSVKDKFAHHLYILEDKVEEAIVNTKFMSRADQDTHFATKNLTAKDVNVEVSDKYRSMKEANKWGPAKTPDSKTVPKAFVSVASSEGDQQITSEDAKQLLVLLQNAGVGNNGTKQKFGKGFTCFGCGAKGFTKRTCPTCSRQSDKSNGRGGGGNRNSGASQGTGGNWKTKAPASGEPETKEVKGRTFRWCAKCRRWSTTHCTATHVTKSGGGGRQCCFGCQRLIA